MIPRRITYWHILTPRTSNFRPHYSTPSSNLTLVRWNLSLDLRSFPSGTRELLKNSGTSELGANFGQITIPVALCTLRSVSSQLRYSTPLLVDGGILFKALFYNDEVLFSSEDGVGIYSG